MARKVLAAQAVMPMAQLVAPSHTYMGESVILAAAGVGIWGLAPLVGQPSFAVPALLLGTGAAATRAIAGTMAARRGQVRDQLVEALAPATGNRGLDRRTVMLSQWSKGTPRRIVVRYAPGTPSADPGWKSTLVDICQHRLQESYEAISHDPRRCCVVLARRIASATSPVHTRVERTIKELIGPTAKIKTIDFGPDGEPVRLTATHEASTKLAASGYRARVERTFSTVQPGRWRARWDLIKDAVTFEIRPDFPANIWLPPSPIDQSKDILSSYQDVAIPYGVDEDGDVLVWRPAIDPNLMVVGSPGTGKTVFEHTVLAGVARYNWPIWVVDGKAVEFLGWRTWPNVQIVATTIEQQVATIQRAWELMEYRYQLIVNGKASENDFEPLMVFLDEFADFRANLLSWYTTIKRKGDPTRPPILEKVASIARKGRTARVHLLFATQRPDAEYFGGDMRDNFRARVSMGRLSPQGAMMMWQDPSVGTSVPRGKRGRATTINDDNKTVEIQTYRAPDPRKATADEQGILDSLLPANRRHDRLLIMPAGLPESDDPSSVYQAVVKSRWARADDYPELDPAMNAPATAEHARLVSSPMSMLGLAGGGPVDTASLEPAAGMAGGEPDGDRLGAEPEGFDMGAGYGPAVDADPESLTVGDLILVEDEIWATVDVEPAPDLFDTECVAVCWRDDADNEGVLNVPFGERVKTRHPLDEQAEA